MSAVKERLAQDVGQWVTDGLISAQTAEKLRMRWDQPSFGFAQIAKYMSLCGAIFCALGILGVLVAATGSETFAGVVLSTVGIGSLYGGMELARNPAGRYGRTCHLASALGLLMLTLGLYTLATSFGVTEEVAVVTAGALALPAAFTIAYRYGNTFLLTLAVLGAFHWVGSWTTMWGSSSYVFAIEQPRLMIFAALASIGFGVYSERRAKAASPRFHHVYQATGLTYLNLSLLILTVWPHAAAAAWIVAWAAAGIAQIVAGARLHSALFTAFGVTALAVNLYTRYFEWCWKALDAGLFMLIGGGLLFAVGLAFERRMQEHAP